MGLKEGMFSISSHNNLLSIGFRIRLFEAYLLCSNVGLYDVTVHLKLKWSDPLVHPFFSWSGSKLHDLLDTIRVGSMLKAISNKYDLFLMSKRVYRFVSCFKMLWFSDRVRCFRMLWFSDRRVGEGFQRCWWKMLLWIFDGLHSVLGNDTFLFHPTIVVGMYVSHEEIRPNKNVLLWDWLATLLAHEH